MEIKRRLTKIAKSLSPQIEAMNVADEIQRMAARMEELIRYAQEKIDRAAERKQTVGQRVAEQKAAAMKEIQDHQKRESNENLADQAESLKEREARANKSKKKEDLRTEDERYADEAAAASRPDAG